MNLPPLTLKEENSLKKAAYLSIPKYVPHF